MKIKHNIEIDPKDILIQADPQKILDFLKYYHPKFYDKHVEKKPEPPPSEYYPNGQWFVQDFYDKKYYCLIYVANRFYLMDFDIRNGFISRWDDIGFPYDNKGVLKKEFDKKFVDELEYKFKPIDFSEVLLSICRKN